MTHVLTYLFLIEIAFNIPFVGAMFILTALAICYLAAIL